jgi:hypothetical protein
MSATERVTNVEHHLHIDFTTVGPVWTKEPKGRPRSTAGRDMVYVQHEKTVIIGLIGFDTNRLACNAFS